MSRYEGLENDVTYIKYHNIREYFIKVLNDDDSKLDIEHLYILLHILQSDRETLDKIKEYRNGEYK